MGIFEELFRKHGHHKNEVVKELLEIIRRMQTEAVLAEHNERLLITENRRLYRDLERCLRGKKPHGAHFDVVF